MTHTSQHPPPPFRETPMQWHDSTPILVTPEGEWRSQTDERPAAVLPGSFNPLHEGHLGLAQVAAEILQTEVTFELSVRNVDKPELDAIELGKRLAQFRGRAPVWLTQAPRFLDKARLFPGAIFVVGADTAERLLQPRYYEGDLGRRNAALATLAAHRCRFLVAARRVGDGMLLTLQALPCPAEFRDLFLEVPVERFRLDVSSTDLRRAERIDSQGP